MSKRSISEVTKVTDIDMQFIQKFIETASEKDIIWILNTFDECHKNEAKKIRTSKPGLSEKDVTKQADRQYFGAFRSKFAKKFYSDLFAAEKTLSKKNPLMDAIEKRRAVLNAAT